MNFVNFKTTLIHMIEQLKLVEVGQNTIIRPSVSCLAVSALLPSVTFRKDAYDNRDENKTLHDSGFNLKNERVPDPVNGRDKSVLLPLRHSKARLIA